MTHARRIIATAAQDGKWMAIVVNSSNNTSRRAFKAIAPITSLALLLAISLQGKVAGQAPITAKSPSNNYDVIVVGGTPAGIAAAIAAGRAGKTVVIIEQSPVLGGVLSSGVLRLDDQYVESNSGVMEEFRQRVRTYHRTELADDHDVPRGHPAFKYIETLYDHSTQSPDPFLVYEVRRVEKATAVLVHPDGKLSGAEAIRIDKTIAAIEASTACRPWWK